MRVLVLVPFKEEHLAQVREAAGEGAEVVCFPRGLSDDELLEQLKLSDVVIGEPSPAVLTQTTNVKLVQMTWAGTDLYTRSTIPFPADTRLCNAVGSYGHIISQHVLGQILNITMNLAGYRDLQLLGEWGDLGDNMSIDGSSVLIFGAGNIGGECARRLAGFDVTKITGVCRTTDTPRPYFDELVTLDQAEALLPESDIVICALPNSDETAHYLDKRRLAMLKPGSVLVNVGRGNFIDNKALAVILDEGKIRGAALDVTDPEPLPENHPLWEEPRCLITPHVSGGAFRHPGTVARTCATACKNIRALAAGGALTNQVL